MAAIYQADVWCDECADRIKYDIVAALLGSDGSFDPNGLLGLIDPDDMAEARSGNSRHEEILEIVGYLDEIDQHDYDSDEYPKGCSDDEECDGPQHCAAGAECIDYSETSDGERYGKFFENGLTSYGDDYVTELVNADLAAGRYDSPAVELWMPYYDYLTFNDPRDAEDEEDCDGEDDHADLPG